VLFVFVGDGIPSIEAERSSVEELDVDGGKVITRGSGTEWGWIVMGKTTLGVVLKESVEVKPVELFEALRVPLARLVESLRHCWSCAAQVSLTAENAAMDSFVVVKASTWSPGSSDCAWVTFLSVKPIPLRITLCT
jgi:hypothetical protein